MIPPGLLSPDGVLRVALTESDGLSGTLAEEIELCAAGFAGANGLDVEDVRRVQREDSLDAFVGHDASYREVFVDSAAFAGDYGAAELLGADLVAFLDSAGHLDNIADFKVRDVLLEAFCFDAFEYFGFHWSISCPGPNCPYDVKNCDS